MNWITKWLTPSKENLINELKQLKQAKCEMQDQYNYDVYVIDGEIDRVKREIANER